MSATLPNTTKESAKALFLQGVSLSDIGQRLDVKPDTVGKWAARYQWLIQKQAVQAQVQKIVSASVVSSLTKQGMSHRKVLARELQSHAEALAQRPVVGIGELFTTKEGQGRTALVKTLVEASSVVFGWDAESANASTIGSGLRDLDDAIDVESSSSCGVDATTGGVPSEQANASTPQLTEGNQTQ